MIVSRVSSSADGYSVYVKSLPLSATPAQLEEEFKKFAPIKPGGIQVRSHKVFIFTDSITFPITVPISTIILFPQYYL